MVNNMHICATAVDTLLSGYHPEELAQPVMLEGLKLLVLARPSSDMRRVVWHFDKNGLERINLVHTAMGPAS